MLVASRNLADYFEAVLAHGVEPKAAANWIMGDMSRLLNENGTEIQDCQVSADKLAGLIHCQANLDY